MSEPDLVQPLLTVDGVLERHHEVVAAKRIAVAQHRQRAVLVAVGEEDLDARLAAQPCGGTQVRRGDHVKLPGDEAVLACRGVGDEERAVAGHDEIGGRLGRIEDEHAIGIAVNALKSIPEIVHGIVGQTVDVFDLVHRPLDIHFAEVCDC